LSDITFSFIFVLRGSVAMELRCGRIFNNYFIANCPDNVPVKIFYKSVNIWQKIRTITKSDVF